MPSFDITSNADIQEVKNAVDQANREVTTRYDLKDTGAEVTMADEVIKLLAGSDMHLNAVAEILRQKLTKRSVSLKLVEFGNQEKVSGDMLKQMVTIKKGLDDKELKSINKEIKAMKSKVSSQTQGEQIRVTGKKRDDLQSVISHLKSSMADLELQFVNFRD